MSKISLCDRITCNGVIDMLSICPVWNWHVYRVFPFFRRGSERVRMLYCFSVLSVSSARKIFEWYQYTLNETKYPWEGFKRFIVALSNSGISDAVIMSILTEFAGYLEKEKTNKLLEKHGWFVPYTLP